MSTYNNRAPVVDGSLAVTVTGSIPITAADPLSITGSVSVSGTVSTSITTAGTQKTILSRYLDTSGVGTGDKIATGSYGTDTRFYCLVEVYIELVD